MKELDTLAEGLKELQDADVVVLWRPFHEMNGGWFWWGGQDPDTFIRVWRHMFDYFTKTKNLNNLFWVYSPNHGPKTADYYAGDNYVDLVGLDAYTDFVDPEHIKGYAEVVQLPKPFGFTEYGPHGPQNPPGDYDYMRFLAGVRKNFPRAAFFQAWSSRWGLGRNENTKELLNDPWLINREDLPRNSRQNRKRAFDRLTLPAAVEIVRQIAATLRPKAQDLIIPLRRAQALHCISISGWAWRGPRCV